MEKKMEEAIHSGELKIGEMTFNCSVLSNGERILTQNDFMAGMGMYYSGWVAKNIAQEKVPAGIPHFLAFKTLEPYVNKHLGELQSIIVKFKTKSGNTAHGIRAKIIPKICDIWLDAEKNIQLGKRQKNIAKKAKIIKDALAHVGIIALVDEATGYQFDRKPDALRLLIQAYIEEELRPWIKIFTDSFFSALDNLYENKKTTSRNRPKYYGNFINKYIYKPLEKGFVKEELDKKNITDEGKRKARFHQWLTEAGKQQLALRIAKIEAIMEISPNKRRFEQNVHRMTQTSVFDHFETTN